MTPGRRRRGALFGLVMGFVAGVLAAALVVPDHGTRLVADGSTTAGGELDTAAGTEAELATGAGEAGSAAGDAPGAGGQQAGTRSGATGSRAGTAPGTPQVGGPVRGVTESGIRIGVAILELGALKALGPAFDNGNRRAHFESVLEAWKRTGQVPVHGRNVEFVYRSYGPLSAAEQRAACVGLVQDERVFAVIADSQFAAGIECVAREYRTPIITSDAPDDSVFQRGSPFIFTLQASQSRIFRNLVHWADRRGSLRGKRVGIYYLNDAVTADVVNRTIKAELARLGYPPPTEATTDQALGGPGDSVAVQRFRAAGVDLAILLTSKAGFMQQAEAQAYRPTYIESDYLSGTTNTATSTYPAGHFDGTFGMTAMRYGEWKAGLPTPAEAQQCAADYERTSGTRVEPNSREAEWIGLNKGCDDARIFIQALHRAGRDLTPVALARSIEATREVPMGIHGRVTFAPDRHHGGDQQRTVQWSRACACWKAIGEFAPFFVP